MEEDLLEPTRKLIQDTMLGIFDVLDSTISDPEIKHKAIEDMQNQLRGTLGEFNND